MINLEGELPIILLQWTENIASKSYFYFNSRKEGINFILKLYEDYITEAKKCLKIIEMTEVLSFIFSLYDFAYLEYDRKKGVYKAYGKDWFSEILINSVNK